MPAFLFIRVPEGKTVKNRVHLDIQPPYGTRDAEVERLVALGARTVIDQRAEDGRGWVVMATRGQRVLRGARHGGTCGLTGRGQPVRA